MGQPQDTESPNNTPAQDPTVPDEVDTDEAGSVTDVEGAASEAQQAEVAYQDVQSQAPLSAEDEEGNERPWIGVQMVDEEGEPIIGQRFVVITPAEEKISGVTAKKGKAAPDGSERNFWWASVKDEGTCQICFVELDKDAWEPA